MLIDAHGRQHDYLRISVTTRCNLRCAYCHNDDAKRASTEMTMDELVKLAGIFAGLGVRKIRLTGGEPLLRTDLIPLVRTLRRDRRIGTLALTTNGVLLRTMADALRTAGLDRLTVSLDSLKHERFADITQRHHLSDVLAGIDEALCYGFTPLNINTVLLPGHNDDELYDFVELARERPINVRFIEHMPVHGAARPHKTMMTTEDVLERCKQRYALKSMAANNISATARIFSIDGFEGTVGCIASMTNHFCETCNRLRLTADGCLRTCLFDAADIDLLTALQTGCSERDLGLMIGDALLNKPAHRQAEGFAGADRGMVGIGG